MIILPRQARDEHRESAQKKCRFPSVTGTGGMDGMRTCSVQHYFTFRMGRPLSLNLTAICTNVERGAGTSANLLSLAHLFPALGNGPAYFARRLLNTPNASSIVGGFDEAVVALLRWSSNGSAADLDALPHRCETQIDKTPFFVRSRDRWFAKTGSGQAQRKLKQKVRFTQGVLPREAGRRGALGLGQQRLVPGSEGGRQRDDASGPGPRELCL